MRRVNFPHACDQKLQIDNDVSNVTLVVNDIEKAIRTPYQEDEIGDKRKTEQLLTGIHRILRIKHEKWRMAFMMINVADVPIKNDATSVIKTTIEKIFQEEQDKDIIVKFVHFKCQ